MSTKTEIAEQLHKQAIIIDGRDPTHLMYEFTKADKPEYIDIVQAGGVTAVVADAAWVDDGFGQAVRAVAAWHRRVKAMKDRARIVYSVQDIREAKQAGQAGFILSFQDSAPVENDVNLVDMWQKLGIRIIEITYQTRNLAGDGCTEKTDCGLSAFGKSLVQRMNECGIVIDLSHVGDQTALDAARLSEQPVILSHTNARNLVNTRRNATDELLSLVASKGGVVGVSAYASIVVKGGGENGASLDQYLDQVDYMIKLLGEDHVGVGFDAGEIRTPAEAALLHSLAAGSGAPPKHRYVEQLNTRTKVPNLTRGLVERGYSDATSKKILGENFMRVFDRVWSSAH